MSSEVAMARPTDLGAHRIIRRPEDYDPNEVS